MHVLSLVVTFVASLAAAAPGAAADTAAMSTMTEVGGVEPIAGNGGFKAIIEEPECDGPAGYVTCDAYDTETCKAKCDAACDQYCVDSGAGSAPCAACSCCDNGDGGDACDQFTGKVCTDSSCSGGEDACTYATIQHVVRGCSGGSQACFEATIQHVVRGCQGERACWSAGKRGSMGSIVDACEGYVACKEAAAFTGSIGSINRSCKTPYSCAGAARHYGTIGRIVDSCTEPAYEDFAPLYRYGPCYSVAEGGSIPNIISGCNAVRACLGAGEYNDIAKAVDECCNTEEACMNLRTSDDFNCDDGLGDEQHPGNVHGALADVLALERLGRA